MVIQKSNTCEDEKFSVGFVGEVGLDSRGYDESTQFRTAPRMKAWR